MSPGRRARNSVIACEISSGQVSIVILLPTHEHYRDKWGRKILSLRKLPLQKVYNPSGQTFGTKIGKITWMSRGEI